ncbi:hypothetical protein MRB53_020907 [Persea americana]|uniref:Uncharacterized protein n=1 Tax=Persea americana TaxID=3435 RepID=A0ACC2L2G0_PERAE|nr:hypothetical protein MRB53_020907 [Persea americana]
MGVIPNQRYVMTGLRVETHVYANAVNKCARKLTRMDLVNVILTALTFVTVGTSVLDADAYQHTPASSV